MMTGQKRTFDFASNLIAWHSNFNAETSRYRNIVENHPINQQIEIVLAGKKGIEIAKTLQWEGAFYYEITANPAMFLDKDFREKYVTKGSVSMLTKNVPIDASNTACLLPTGNTTPEIGTAFLTAGFRGADSCCQQGHVRENWHHWEEIWRLWQEETQTLSNIAEESDP